MGLIQSFFNWDILVQSFPILLRGLLNTLLLGITAIILGSFFGLVLCFVRLYAPKPFRYAAITFIDVFRALPILVVLTYVYYALPLVGITLSSFTSATLSLTLVLSAFTAEVCRMGIETVPKGQFEAASSLGLPFWQSMRKIVMPQAFKVMLPQLTSNAVSTFKDTSLASVVAMQDLLKQATNSQALFGNPTPLLGAAIIYLLFLWPLVRLVGYLEKKSAAGKTAR